jgi:hypothetical protein
MSIVSQARIPRLFGVTAMKREQLCKGVGRPWFPVCAGLAFDTRFVAYQIETKSRFILA